MLPFQHCTAPSPILHHTLQVYPSADLPIALLCLKTLPNPPDLGVHRRQWALNPPSIHIPRMAGLCALKVPTTQPSLIQMDPIQS